MADVKVRIIAQDEASPPLDKIGKEAAKTKQAFAGLESGLLSMAAAFGLTNVIGSVANAFKSLITDSFQLAAGLEQAKIAFTTMLGSAEKSDKMLKELKAFADKTPFEFLELQDAAKRMMAYGFAAKDVIPTLEAVGNAAGALGGGGAMIQRITTALGQMSAKGKVGNDDLRQLAETGIPALKHLADAAGVTTGAMSKMIEKGIIPADQAVKVLIASMQRDFGGLMAKQAETAAGKLSTMKDAVAGAKTEIGAGFIPVVKGYTEVVTAAAKVTETWAARNNTNYGELLKLQAMVKIGAISFEEYATVTNEVLAAQQNVFGPLLMAGQAITDQAGAAKLMADAQKHLNEQYAISRTRLEDYKGAVEVIVPTLTPMQKAINEQTEAYERQATALSSIKGVYGNYNKTRGDLLKTEGAQKDAIAKLTKDFNAQSAAIRAGSGTIVDNSDAIERALISQGRLGISVNDLNERFANTDGIDRYNEGTADINASIAELNAEHEKGLVSAEDFAKQLDNLNDRQGDLKRTLDNGQMSQEAFGLSTRDNTLDSKDLEKKLAELRAEHGQGKTAAELLAIAQGQYNTKLKEAQTELQKTKDKEAEMRTFVADQIKADLLEKQIAALAIDGLTQAEIKGIQDTAIAFGLAKDERIKGLLIEGAAASAFAKLEADHALDYIKDGDKKAIAHAAFVDSIGKDITMGLIPNYDKALEAAKAANGAISETASIYNGLNSKEITLTIITRQIKFGEGKDAKDTDPNVKGPNALPQGPYGAPVVLPDAVPQGPYGPPAGHAAGGVFGINSSPFMVGERGAEIIDPSGGGRVYSATQTANMGNNAGAQSLRINTLNVYGVQDTGALFAALQKEARARGMVLIK